MNVRARMLPLILAAAGALALPAAAWAHAALLHTSPSASGIVNTPPARVLLTFSEAVEPRFAIVSVTNAAGTRVTAGAPTRSAADPDTLVVPLRKIGQGWYLVYWRVISVDGHPVRSAFTFAVGPSPGPEPQFVIPSISETAATPRLIAARTITFVAVMVAIGLFVLRIAIARPVVRRVSGTSLRAVSIAFAIASVVALVAIPVYVVLATADFALRSAVHLGALFPLLRTSAFGRGYLDLELAFGLFAIAAAVAIAVDRPDREHRSIAELLSTTGVLLAAAGALLIPGVSGHAGQTSPRGWAITLDWLHLVAGSVWVGGLVGLLILWRSLPAARRVAGLVVCVPRFSNVAFVSVLTLIGSGTGAAVLHMPTLASFWQTSYGQALIVKICLLATAMLLASVNLLRNKPRLAAYRERPELGPGAATLLRGLVSGEVLLVATAIGAAAVLSSLAPPSKALASIGHASAHVGPGSVLRVVNKNGYKLTIRVAPNRAAVPNSFSVKITRNGKPVRGADVTTSFAMLDMQMAEQEFRFPETSPGTYEQRKPALVMVGHWGLSFDVTVPGRPPFTVLLVDHATG